MRFEVGSARRKLVVSKRGIELIYTIRTIVSVESISVDFTVHKDGTIDYGSTGI